MRKSLYVCAAGIALAFSAGSGHAMSINNIGGMNAAIDATNPTQEAALFVVEGRRYCFYFNGWHGPGWYRCGFAWRRGLGWGGVYGWHGWRYGAAERRFGHRRVIEGNRIHERATRRGETRIHRGSREGTRTEERARIRGNSSIRERRESRSNSFERGGNLRGNSTLRGTTEGRGHSFRGNLQGNVNRGSTTTGMGSRGSEGRGGASMHMNAAPSGGGAARGGAGGGGGGGGSSGGRNR